MELTCDKCPLFGTCPKKGTSPFLTTSGKILKCHLAGPYGKDPVDVSILSEASLERMKKDGPCTSYVEVPALDEGSGKVHFQTVVVFHHPIMHDRQKPIVDSLNAPFRQSYKIQV